MMTFARWSLPSVSSRTVQLAMLGMLALVVTMSRWLVSPYISTLFNISVVSDFVRPTLKEAYITPIIKKLQLERTDINNYQPTSNLSVISKLLERTVCSQLAEYIDNNNLMPPNQSAYRKSHSTETALTAVFSDIISELNRDNLVMLRLVWYLAASNTIITSVLRDELHWLPVPHRVIYKFVSPPTKPSTALRRATLLLCACLHQRTRLVYAYVLLTHVSYFSQGPKRSLEIGPTRMHDLGHGMICWSPCEHQQPSSGSSRPLKHIFFVVAILLAEHN